MIEPMMATMLGFVTTDAGVPRPLLDRALREAVDDTFNAITVDGECSTNDCVMLLANGASGVAVDDAQLRRVHRRAARRVPRAGARHRARRRGRDQAGHGHGDRRGLDGRGAAGRQGDRQLAARQDRHPRRRPELGPADCRGRPRRRRLRAVARARSASARSCCSSNGRPLRRGRAARRPSISNAARISTVGVDLGAGERGRPRSGRAISSAEYVRINAEYRT